MLCCPLTSCDILAPPTYLRLALMYEWSKNSLVIVQLRQPSAIQKLTPRNYAPSSSERTREVVPEELQPRLEEMTALDTADRERRNSLLKSRLHRVPAWVWFGLYFVGLVALVRTGHLSVVTALSLAVLVPSIIVHEVAHGLMAYACGDDTAKKAGRLTANPAKHVSLWGTFILPIFFVVAFGSGFGFAKPVPVDLDKTRKPRHASLLISFAGPVSNLALVALCFAVSRIADVPGQIIDRGYVSVHQLPLWILGLYLLGLQNLWLAIFNLMPIPPLDGSAIIERLLPHRALKGYYRFRSFALPLVFIVVFFAPGPLSWLSNHVADFWFSHFFG